MDKDSVILKYLQNEAADCEKDITGLSSKNSDNASRLNDVDSKLDEIYRLLGKQRKAPLCEVKEKTDDAPLVYTEEPKTYDELFIIAADSLSKRGIDVDNLDYHNLVSEKDLKYIIDNLNRPLERKLKWTKNDFIAVFVAASIGSLIDFILSDRQNKFTGKDSQFAEWLDQFHKHDGGGPIDYLGKGFGGRYHRGLSKGHDILRFIEAIIMFKTGRFEGVRYIDGVAHKVVYTANEYGRAYDQLGWIEAILKYAGHMFGDLFSTCSLPFPGSFFLAESNSRAARKLAATMYQQGFNIKNIMVQSLSTVAVEIILRIYFGIDEVKRFKEDIEVEEDYSNFEAVKRFIRPTGKDKLYEMLLLAHAIVTAINIGKVVVTKKPWEINVSEIISVIRYAIPVISSAIDRHSEYAKLIRNANEINRNWEALALDISVDKVSLEFPPNSLII